MRQAPGQASDCSTAGPHRAGSSEVERHEVVMVDSDPTGMTLDGEVALAGVDVAVIERRSTPEPAGSRAGGPDPRAPAVLHQRGMATTFLVRIHGGHK